MFKRFLSILILALLIVSVVTAQDDENDTPEEDIVTIPDLTLFVEEGIMTLYVSHNQPVDIQGFQFQSIQNGELTEFSPIIRFRILEAQEYMLDPGTCLVYLFDADAPIPEVCETNLVQISSVNTGDRFWTDRDGNRQTIVFLRDNDIFGEPCGQLSTVCSIYFTVTEPVLSSLDPQPANWESYTPIINNNRRIRQSSSQEAINDIIATSDNDYFISGHQSGNICVWKNDEFDTSALECFDSDITGHIAGISAMERNPHLEEDRLGFITVGAEGFARLWTIDISNNGESIILRAVNEDEPLNFRESITDLSWNPHSETVAFATSERIHLWDAIDGSLPPIPIANAVALAWRPNGEYLAVVDTEGIARVVNTNTADGIVNITQIDNYGSRVSGVDVTWNPFNNDLIILSEEDDLGAARVYANFVPESGCDECYNDFIAQNLNQISQVTMSPDGEYLAVAAKGAIHILESEAPYLLLGRYSVDDSNEIVFTSVTWNTTNDQLIAGDEDGVLYIWDIDPTFETRLTNLRSWEVSSQREILGLSWQSNGEILSIVDQSRNLSIWDSYGNSQGNTLAHREIPLAIDWHPFGNIVVTGGCGPSVTIWEEDIIAQIILPGEQFNCTTAVDFDPTGEILASMNQGGILTLWDWANEVEVGIGRSFDSQVNDLAWSPSGANLAFVDSNGVLQIFSTDNLTLRETLVRQPEQGVAFNNLAWSQDNNLIATASDNNWIAIWETEDENIEEDYPFEGSFLLKGHNAPVIALSWSSRNNWLVSIGADNKIIVWDVITGQRLAEIVTESTPTDVQWIPNVPSFAVGDNEGTITIYSFEF